MKELKVYMIVVSEDAMPKDCPTTYSDEYFMEIAQKQGHVYSLKDFERNYNFCKDLMFCEDNFIRFI